MDLNGDALLFQIAGDSTVPGKDLRLSLPGSEILFAHGDRVLTRRHCEGIWGLPYIGTIEENVGAYWTRPKL